MIASVRSALTRPIPPKWLISGTVLAVLGGVGALVYFAPAWMRPERRPVLKYPVGPELCDLIRPGMTLAEAEEALGGPPGWYEDVVSISTDVPLEKKGPVTWIGRRGELYVKL